MDWEQNVTRSGLSQLNKSLKTDTIEVVPYAAHESQEIKHKRNAFLFTYTGIMALGIFAFMFRSVSFYRMCLRISINLHDMIFRGITRAKMIFFNNNPSGRILNRFARDINNVDSLLPNAMFNVIDVSFSCHH